MVLLSLCFLQAGLRYVFDAVTLRNNEAMEELLQASIELALGMYSVHHRDPFVH